MRLAPVLIVLFACCASMQADEHGELKIYFLQNPVGQETYELVGSGTGSILQAAFGYSERESTVHLDATLKMKADLTPETFRAEGKSYRPFSVHAHFDAHENKGLPANYFALSGYAPLSVQMMMLRYWNQHGRPERLRQFPAATSSADISIRVSGRDDIHNAVGGIHLTRYSVRNVVWGCESVWMNDAGEIAAAVTYAGGLPLEAIRPEYADALPQLIRTAVADRIEESERLKRSLPPLAEGSFAITGATLIDGTGRAPIPNAVVIIRNERIVSAGSRQEVEIPRGMPVIAAPGATLLPGLWDMHSHFAQTEWGPTYLAAGVTSVRDCGNEFEFITAERDAVGKEEVLGPQLLLAGLVDGSGPKTFGTTWADTPEQGRAVVAHYQAAGFSQMKIYDWVRPDVLRAIADEAHREGMTVTGHVPRGMTAEQAVEAGMDQINHIGAVLEAADRLGKSKAIEFFHSHGTVIDPTISWNELLGRPVNFPISSFEPGFAKAPYVLASLIETAGTRAANTQQSPQLHEQLDLLKALHQAGVPIVAGTDKGIPGHSLHRELELYVEAGIAPLDVIRIATAGAAHAMRVENEVGTVEAGKRADLILVDGNPLVDFAALRRVTQIVTKGRMYDTAPLWRSVDFQSTQ